MKTVYINMSWGKNINAAEVKKGDMIRWRNDDSSSVHIFFPDTNTFGESFCEVVPGNSDSENYFVNYGDDKTVYYDIFHIEANDFFEGNSRPAIIIKR